MSKVGLHFLYAFNKQNISHQKHSKLEKLCDISLLQLSIITLKKDTADGFVRMNFIPMLFRLLKYLVADFVENMDFLEQKVQTFRLKVQHGATHVCLDYTTRLSLHVFFLDSDSLSFYCYCPLLWHLTYLMNKIPLSKFNCFWKIQNTRTSKYMAEISQHVTFFLPGVVGLPQSSVSSHDFLSPPSEHTPAYPHPR